MKQMMYLETELVFMQDKPVVKTAVKSPGKNDTAKTEVLGITLRLGNQPLVYRLNKLNEGTGITGRTSSGRDHYLIVHAISAVKTQGRAKVEELQYVAAAIEPGNLQTVDLVPKTRFNEVVSVNANLVGAMDLSGQIFLDVPETLTNHLLSEYVDLAPDIRLQLSASSQFIGKISYSVQIPVVQASGVGSDTCCWVLRPDEKKTPLLGDQLLVQSISVPAGTPRIIYELSGLVKADKGIFWKQQQKETGKYKIEVELFPASE